MNNNTPHTDPQLDGHERFRVSKENFGVSNDTREMILNNLNTLHERNTTLSDGLYEIPWDDDWHADTKL
jgi:hypothetical protein